MLSDLVVQHGLREERLVDLVVTHPPVANHINDAVLAELDRPTKQREKRHQVRSESKTKIVFTRNMPDACVLCEVDRRRRHDESPHTTRGTLRGSCGVHNTRGPLARVVCSKGRESRNGAALPTDASHKHPTKIGRQGGVVVFRRNCMIANYSPRQPRLLQGEASTKMYYYCNS